jgi:hypothetical protein
LVFIGAGIEEDAIRRALDLCLVSDFLMICFMSFFKKEGMNKEAIWRALDLCLATNEEMSFT